MNSSLVYQSCADAVLAAHFAIALFVVGGFLLVLVGNACSWRWVNAMWFRLAHLFAIVFIVSESWLGITCPLTTLEAWLRARAGETTYGGGFIEHWVGRIMFYQAPAWVFTLAYTLFGLLVVVVWWVFPPTITKQPGKPRGTDRIEPLPH